MTGKSARITLAAPILAVVLLAPGRPSPAQPLPDGPEMLLDPAGGGGRVSAESAGDFVVAWYALAGAGYDVLAQRFDGTGVPDGAPFRVNTSTTVAQYFRSPDVAMTGNSGFVVVWGDYMQIKTRRYDGDGAPAADPSVVGPPPPPTIDPFEQLPAVAGSSAGSFVVAWVSDYLAEYHGYTDARVFDTAGEPMGTAFRVGESDYGYRVPDVDMDDDGDFVVVWSESVVSPIFMRRYDASGQSQGSIDIVNPGQHSAGEGVIDLAGSGEFVVAWRGRDLATSGREIFIRQFDAQGTAQGPRVVVATAEGSVPGQTRRASVARNDVGDVVVVWTDNDEGKCCVFGQRFEPDGSPDGGEFQVNTSAGPAPGVDVAMDGGGNFTIVWETAAGVLARRYCGSLRVSGPVGDEVCVGGATAFEAMPAGRFPFGFKWRRNGVPLVDGGTISGSEGPVLSIDPVASSDAADYDVVVTDSCAAPSDLTSPPASLIVVEPVGEVSGLTLRLSSGSLIFNWTDEPGAADYAVTEDVSPDGPFLAETGVASSGSPGLTVPLPPGNRYYLVAGRNTACGTGP